MKNLYQDKDISYYSSVRSDLLRLIPQNPLQKILEVGAAKGDTLVAIKEKKIAKEVVGIDLFEMPGTNQGNPLIDKFLITDIENDNLNSLEPEYFDVIICGDVLEHLADPWSVVVKLGMLLKKDGIFVSSIPNIRHYSTLYKIFEDGLGKRISLIFG